MIMQHLTKVTEEQEDAITSLRISLRTDSNHFNECISVMEGALRCEGFMADYVGAEKYQEALKHLAEIEDAIKRFREGRTQTFDED